MLASVNPKTTKGHHMKKLLVLAMAAIALVAVDASAACQCSKASGGKAGTCCSAKSAGKKKASGGKTGACRCSQPASEKKAEEAAVEAAPTAEEPVASAAEAE
jgi:hypothetical protein